MNRLKIFVIILFLFNLCNILVAKYFLVEIKIENITFRISYGKVIIEYDLIGPADQKYEVFLLLKKETTDTFVYIPLNVTGDIGKGSFAGNRRQILWDLSKEFPDWFDPKDKDYYFVVNVYVISKGISPLIWIGGGAALLGGAAALLLFKKDSGGDETPNVIRLPNPPGRPSQ